MKRLKEIARQFVPINTIAYSEGEIPLDYKNRESTLYWRGEINKGGRPVLEVEDMLLWSSDYKQHVAKHFPLILKPSMRWFLTDGHHRMSAYLLEHILSVPIEVVKYMERRVRYDR